MNVKGLLAVATLMTTLTTPVFALSLDQARAQGWVGESASGLLVARPGAAPSVQSFVNEINTGRMQEFQRGAQKTGVDTKTFQQRMGQRLIQRLKPGQWYQDEYGHWQQK